MTDKSEKETNSDLIENAEFIECGIRLPKQLLKDLEEIAIIKNISTEALINIMIRDYILNHHNELITLSLYNGISLSGFDYLR